MSCCVLLPLDELSSRPLFLKRTSPREPFPSCRRQISDRKRNFRLQQTTSHFSTSTNVKMPPVPKPTSNHYDMVVIGGGSGAMGVSRRAAAYGKKVCVIEEDGRLGGTCVNVGCVPKKLMWHAADMAEHLKEAPEYGFGDVNNKPSIPSFRGTTLPRSAMLTFADSMVFTTGTWTRTV